VESDFLTNFCCHIGDEGKRLLNDNVECEMFETGEQKIALQKNI
jgi:hypothetical protein